MGVWMNYKASDNDTRNWKGTLSLRFTRSKNINSRSDVGTLLVPSLYQCHARCGEINYYDDNDDDGTGVLCILSI